MGLPPPTELLPVERAGSLREVFLELFIDGRRKRILLRQLLDEFSALENRHTHE
jgi:hypothetical protein